MKPSPASNLEDRLLFWWSKEDGPKMTIDEEMEMTPTGIVRHRGAVYFSFEERGGLFNPARCTPKPGTR